MWFGNLVTCNDWGNIFIHKAVANYLSYKILNHLSTKLNF